MDKSWAGWQQAFTALSPAAHRSVTSAENPINLAKMGI